MRAYLILFEETFVFPLGSNDNRHFPKIFISKVIHPVNLDFFSIIQDSIFSSRTPSESLRLQRRIEGNFRILLRASNPLWSRSSKDCFQQCLARILNFIFSHLFGFDIFIKGSNKLQTCKGWPDWICSGSSFHNQNVLFLMIKLDFQTPSLYTFMFNSIHEGNNSIFKLLRSQPKEKNLTCPELLSH